MMGVRPRMYRNIRVYMHNIYKRRFEACYAVNERGGA